MTQELNVLLLSVVLAFVYLMVHGSLLRRQIGYGQENANRDNDPEPGLMAGRGIRAFRNFLETYPLFLALVLATSLSGHSGFLTQWGAWLWLIARALYLPAYIFGLGYGRSAIWMASLAGLGMMLLGAFGL
ncbi:MAPEG family protein [Gellertiella hungarica]|uniref:Putative MAPEG superfamily protein n=1 Tax=Gellertiella hungarica TaxID=1572859 RepID=A0A7W6J5M1_9HYPH|nr:MAPEG family protein [Gellertiella hungarica]MBB4065218.1 putative MAPEG superfamily protein [Gellertiella hungarica]